MEPPGVRASPAGLGWREETPHGEPRDGAPDGGARNAEGADGAGDAGDDAGGAGEDAEREPQELKNICEEELDPRIQEELEHLNEASEEINRLELQLDDARSAYRRILTDSARKLNAQGSQLGSCIEKARPYYEARRLAKEAQQETQKAALRYERAVSMHTAAREMVYVAEQGLLADRNTLDPTWQEMLNHATSKVNEAEEERLRSEREHQRVTQLCQEAEARVQTLQKALKRVIIKSKPYFELKAQLNHILEENKSKVLQLEERVSKVKTQYSVALRNLEQISEQIHAQRGRNRAAAGETNVCSGRSPPVGAESDLWTASEGGTCGAGALENMWANGNSNAEKTRAWVERHRESGWGEKERAEAEKTSSDSLSVLSLQTIASDLEKCDSVEHLGDFLSDGVSLSGEEGERESAVKDEEGAGGRDARTTHTAGKERQESFAKQHYRSASL
ncbi:SH3 domain-binding protein 5-like [Arapaima gigas]